MSLHDDGQARMPFIVTMARWQAAGPLSIRTRLRSFSDHAETPRPFDFLVVGELVRQPLQQLVTALGISAVGTAQNAGPARRPACRMSMSSIQLLLEQWLFWCLYRARLLINVMC